MAVRFRGAAVFEGSRPAAAQTDSKEAPPYHPLHGQRLPRIEYKTGARAGALPRRSGASVRRADGPAAALPPRSAPCRFFKATNGRARNTGKPRSPFSPTRCCTNVPREVGKTVNFRLYDRKRRLGRLFTYVSPIIYQAGNDLPPLSAVGGDCREGLAEAVFSDPKLYKGTARGRKNG